MRMNSSMLEMSYSFRSNQVSTPQITSGHPMVARLPPVYTDSAPNAPAGETPYSAPAYSATLQRPTEGWNFNPPDSTNYAVVSYIPEDDGTCVGYCSDQTPAFPGYHEPLGCNHVDGSAFPPSHEVHEGSNLSSFLTDSEFSSFPMTDPYPHCIQPAAIDTSLEQDYSFVELPGISPPGSFPPVISNSRTVPCMTQQSMLPSSSPSFDNDYFASSNGKEHDMYPSNQPTSCVTCNTEPIPVVHPYVHSVTKPSQSEDFLQVPTNNTVPGTWCGYVENGFGDCCQIDSHSWNSLTTGIMPDTMGVSPLDSCHMADSGQAYYPSYPVASENYQEVFCHVLPTPDLSVHYVNYVNHPQNVCELMDTPNRTSFETLSEHQVPVYPVDSNDITSVSGKNFAPPPPPEPFLSDFRSVPGRHVSREASVWITKSPSYFNRNNYYVPAEPPTLLNASNSSAPDPQQPITFVGHGMPDIPNQPDNIASFRTDNQLYFSAFDTEPSTLPPTSNYGNAGIGQRSLDLEQIPCSVQPADLDMRNQPSIPYSTPAAAPLTELDPSNTTCPHCSRAFSRPSHVEIHLRTHTGVRPHQCILCGRQFNQASNLRRHLNSHKSWPPTPSVSVTMSLTSRDIHTDQATLSVSSNELALRRRAVANSKHWACRFCEQNFPKYSELRAHMTQHRSRRVYACVFANCLCTFPAPDLLLAHVIEVHRNIGQDDLTCKTCGRTFLDKKKLVQHWLPRRRGLPSRCDRTKPKHKSLTQSVSNYRLGALTQAPTFALSRTRLHRCTGRRHSSATNSGSLNQVKTRIRLLTLQKPSRNRLLPNYRCPVCLSICRSLKRFRRHFTTLHSDQLVSVAQEASVLSGEVNTRSSGNSSRSPTSVAEPFPVLGPSSPQPGPNHSLPVEGQSERTNSNHVHKSTLFLLEVDNSCEIRPSCMTSTNCEQAVNGVEIAAGTLSCKFCGKGFQKMKFFTDHQLMCEQKIKERARRERLRTNRQLHFRLTDAESADCVTSTMVDDVVAPDPISSTDGVRRSLRVRSFRQLWLPKTTRAQSRRPKKISSPEKIDLSAEQPSDVTS
ncbi:unnamed protein product [Calicophoron daubneyi]|uniref:C2H2-type domain-containing protein n=1 Tax=Calicophoron daubneyi TaxID=300641 RepID=A0AAV2TIC1_CALDB